MSKKLTFKTYKMPIILESKEKIVNSKDAE